MPKANKETLLAKRRELAARIERIQADRRHVRAPLDQDLDDQAVQIQNDEVLEQLERSERQELARLDAQIAKL